MWRDFDYLVEKYPALKEKIMAARARGVSDDFIHKFLAEEFEPRLNFFGNPETVNKFLGRTPERMERLRRYEEQRNFLMYKKAFPDKSDEDTTNAIWLGQITGISPYNILNDPKVFKKAAEGRVLNYQWVGDSSVFDKVPNWRKIGIWDASKGYMQALGEYITPDTSPIVIGYKNFIATRQLADAGMALNNGEITYEEFLKQKAEISKNFLPIPIVDTGINRAVRNAAGIVTQGKQQV